MGYWEQRVAKTGKQVADKSIKETTTQLAKYYKRTMKSVINDFEATYDKLLSTVENGKVILPNDLYKLDKYWTMQAELQKKLQALGDKQTALMSKKFQDTYKSVYKAIPLKSDTAFKTFSEQNAKQVVNQIWCADGKSWSNRVWTNTESLKDTLNKKLVECVVGGKTTDELKIELQKRFGVSYHRSDTLVRTEITHIQTQASADRYKDAGCEEYEVLVNPDERTCDECAKFDGERFKFSEMVIGVNAPPFHANCRDTIIPVINKGE